MNFKVDELVVCDLVERWADGHSDRVMVRDVCGRVIGLSPDSFHAVHVEFKLSSLGGSIGYERRWIDASKVFKVGALFPIEELCLK